MVESFSAITWEPLVRLISNLEKAHPQVPSNIRGKFQVDRTSGCRETAVTHTQTNKHTEIAGIIDRLVRARTCVPVRAWGKKKKKKKKKQQQQRFRFRLSAPVRALRLVESFSAITWEPLVRLISNLEKAHPRVPSNIPGKFQVHRTSGRRETAVTHTHTHTHRQTHTQRLLEL